MMIDNGTTGGCDNYVSTDEDTERRKDHSVFASVLTQMQSGERATVYYEPDATFLCWAYNTSVHGTNFLVAYHVRQVTCAARHFLDTSCCLPLALCGLLIL